MRILLINPPYQTHTSRRGVGHQIPLGLLMVGGPLVDAGHEVRLLDAEARELDLPRIVREVNAFAPAMVMTGHAGSTPAHPVTMRMLGAIKAECPRVLTVYGGVYPTCQAAAILAGEPAVDAIVRGEGEETALRLVQALAAGATDWTAVTNLAFRRRGGEVVLTPESTPIRELDAYRVAYELIEDWDRYQCFGLGRAAIVQLSRGCPHRCNYCGQFGFWRRWRHRDPIRVVDEIERLHREHGIRFFTLADENPTTLPGVWRAFLEELAKRRLPVRFFATIRATDIVRDAALLDLARRAGLLYVLMGIETTNARVIDSIDKESSTAVDLRACRLLRQHGIFSIIAFIVGFEHETLADFRAARRALADYDGDHLNAMYATPHPWTTFARDVAERRIAEHDLSRWDYRHQVLAHGTLAPWQLFCAVKWLEFSFHLRPRRLRRVFRDPDPGRRRQLRWCLRRTGAVFVAETCEFLQRASRRTPRLTVGEFLGMPGATGGPLHSLRRAPGTGVNGRHLVRS